MKSYREEVWFNITKRREFINITPVVNQALAKSKIKEGLVLVNAMHITSSVFINDDESGLHEDFEKWLEKLAPELTYSQYKHNYAEDNADAHLKRQVMGREVVVAVTDGKLTMLNLLKHTSMMQYYSTTKFTWVTPMVVISQWFQPTRSCTFLMKVWW